MSRGFSARKTGFLAIVTALALPGGVAAILLASGGSFTSELAATVRPTPSAPALAAAAPAGQGATSPIGGPAVASPAATAPASPAPKIVATPPPVVVDGVPRVDVGLAHSPQIQRQLSASGPAGPPPVGAGALGVDVADYQHRNGALIDWQRVAAAGYKFAFVKATEGDYYVNPWYAYDLAQAKAAGLYVAGYHFAIPNVSGGASQADYALQNGAYAAGGRTLPLALDIEYNPYGPECYGLTPAAMVSWVSSFTAEAKRLTGQLPIIYTTADWWNTCTDDSTAFGADQLWVAAFGADRPPLPAGWSNWTLWQYTSRGSVPGITGPVDLSYFLSAVRLADPGNQASGQPARPPSAPPPSASAPSSPPPASSPPASSPPASDPPSSPSVPSSPPTSPPASASASPSPSAPASPSPSASPSDSPSPSPSSAPSSPSPSPSASTPPSPSTSPSETPSSSGSPSSAFPSPSLSPPPAPALQSSAMLASPRPSPRRGIG